MKFSWQALAVAALVAAPTFAGEGKDCAKACATACADKGVATAKACADKGVTAAQANTMTTMSGTIATKTVDASALQDHMGDLRELLNRISENNTLAAASGDFVHADAFRRSNEIMLDNASALAMTILDHFGTPVEVQPGYGLVRAHIDNANAHLRMARMTASYGIHVNEAKANLDAAYAAMGNASTMSGR